MVALDSSALIAFLAGASGRDTDLVDRLLADHQACLPPEVLTEILRDPKLPKQVAELLRLVGAEATVGSLRLGLA